MTLAMALALSACGPSSEKIADGVKAELQHRLQGQEIFAQHKVSVAKVDVVKEEGNKFRGMATIMLDGHESTIPIEIVADGDKAIFDVPQDRLVLLAFELLGRSKPAVEPAAAEAPPPSMATKTALWEADNERCRGGSGDDPATAQACDARDQIYKQITSEGWCWGHRDDIGADRKWVKCLPGDA
jgi:hypothetical protein